MSHSGMSRTVLQAIRLGSQRTANERPRGVSGRTPGHIRVQMTQQLHGRTLRNLKQTPRTLDDGLLSKLVIRVGLGKLVPLLETSLRSNHAKASRPLEMFTL